MFAIPARNLDVLTLNSETLAKNTVSHASINSPDMTINSQYHVSTARILNQNIMNKPITANDISRLLHQKHSVEKFLCVDECKTGSTWFSSRCPRLDLWVMARSYTNARFIGYEIKVSRQDFLRDIKWAEYLKYCTEFYFVTPPDIIDPAEVPEQAGLLITSKNCKRLMTKKKAPVRDVEIPTSLLIYILMSRARIVGDMFQTRPKTEIWKEKLQQLKSNKKLGHALAYQIKSRVDKEVKDIRVKNDRLRLENDRLKDVKTWLEKKGVSLNDVMVGYGVRHNRLEELITGLPYGFVNDIQRANQNLKDLLDKLTPK